MCPNDVNVRDLRHCKGRTAFRDELTSRIIIGSTETTFLLSCKICVGVYTLYMYLRSFAESDKLYLMKYDLITSGSQLMK